MTKSNKEINKYNIDIFFRFLRYAPAYMRAYMVATPLQIV